LTLASFSSLIASLASPFALSKLPPALTSSSSVPMRLLALGLSLLLFYPVSNALDPSTPMAFPT